MTKCAAHILVGPGLMPRARLLIAYLPAARVSRGAHQAYFNPSTLEVVVGARVQRTLLQVGCTY